MPDFLFVGNDPTLDLVNTEVILDGIRTDLLQSFEDLTQWLKQANLASANELRTKPRWILEKPRDLLVPLAHCAANFFATADYPAIRKCEDPKCILWFYDSSKNHSRRWCSMELCGNRAKVAAFRERL